MTMGNLVARPNAARTLPEKLLALLLTAALALSLTPTAAWGAGAAQDPGAPTATEDADTGAQAGEPEPAVAAMPSDESGATAETAEAEGAPQAHESSQSASLQPDEKAPAASQGEAAQAAASPASKASEQTAVIPGASTQSAPAATPQAAARAAISFKSGYYCANIATTPHYATSTPGASGNQQVGTTLYALAFKSASGSAAGRTPVKDDGSLTYVWYASEGPRSAKELSESDVISGATASSLTLTDDLVGKYLFVKIIASDGSSASGPRLAGAPSKNHYGAGPVIEAPKPKDALDEYAYILIQEKADENSTLSKVDAGLLKSGDTLWANVYDSEKGSKLRIPHQERWSYQWLAGDTREDADADFTPIDGQTGPSLTLTDGLAAQLAGKYLRVRIIGDGHTLYGPSGSFNTPDSIGYNTPGPVMAPGQIAIAHIVLASNGAPFGDDYENTPTCTVGDTLQAAAYYLSYDTPTDLYGGDAVNFSWQTAASAEGPFTEVARGESFAVPSDLAGSYLRVVATAKNGVPGSDTCQTPAGRVLAKGQAELSRVSILNRSAGDLTCGMTLQAQAYQGDYWTEAPVGDEVEVTYTWRWTRGNPTRGDFDEEATPWHEIEGARGASLTVSDSFEGCFIGVAATAGVNTVSTEDGSRSSAAGPFGRAAEEPPAQEARFAATVTITGASAAKPGQAATAETWVAPSEYRWGSEGTTAWDAFRNLLDAGGFFYSLDGGFPYSITTPDRVTTLAMSANAPWKYWAFFVNGRYADCLAMSYLLQDGDRIELRYVDEGGSIAPPSGAVTANPDAAVENRPVQWGGFANGGAGSVVQSAATATDATTETWTASLLSDNERAAGAMASVSDALMIGGKLYVVSGASTFNSATGAMDSTLARLTVMDPASGAAEQTLPLGRPMDFTCRPIYGDGVLVIPLAGGFVQAVSVASLETLWVAEAVSTSAQSLSTLTIENGYVYVATADTLDASFAASSGTVRRYNLRTGALAGTAANTNAGHYWGGGIACGDYFLMPDDSGTVTVYRSDLSAVAGTMKVSDGRLRSSLVRTGDGILAVSSDGVLHKLALADDGTLSETGAVKFAASSTGTPTVVGNTVYVGGSAADYTGVLAAIDLGTLAVATVGKADGAPLPAEVKSTPLVSVQPGGTFVYFTCNAEPGNLYVWKTGEGEARALYTPTGEHANWCTASPAAGPDGTLYYTNDSGTLFALGAAESAEDPIEPAKPEQPGVPEQPAPGTETNVTTTTAGTSEGGSQVRTFHPTGRTPLAGTLSGRAATTAAGASAPGTVAESNAADAIDGNRTPLADVSGSNRIAERNALPLPDQDTTGGARPVALLGLAVGMAGLATALGFLLRRRKDNEEA